MSVANQPKLSGIAKWRSAFNALSSRERILIAGTVLVFIFALLFLFVIEPKQKETTQLNMQTAQQQQKMLARKVGLNALNKALEEDPSAPIRTLVDQLISQDQAMTARVLSQSEKLIDPNQMNSVLESVLKKEPNVQLVELKTLAVKRLDLISEPDGTAPSAGDDVATNADGTAKIADIEEIPVYEHPFELKIRGSYAAVYNYLYRLEQLSKAFFWDEIELQVDEFPDTEVMLRIHTLSGEEGWLGG